jgi:hypothetical protein
MAIGGAGHCFTEEWERAVKLLKKLRHRFPFELPRIFLLRFSKNVFNK